MPRSDVYIGIGSDGVNIADSKTRREWQAEYPAGVVENLEVKDPDGYLKWWGALLNKLEINNRRILVVMTEPVLFYKQVKNDEDAEKFLREVPLSPEQVSKNVFWTDSGQVAVATNLSLHLKLAEAAEENKCQISGVFPETILAVRQPSEVLKIKNIPVEANFVKPVESVRENSERKFNPAPYYKYLFLILVLLIIIATALILNRKQTETKPVLLVPMVKVSGSIVPTITVKPTPAKPDLKTVRIKVLNGSGVDGKAHEIALFLEARGFAKVETGNIRTASNAGIMIATNNFPALGDKLYSDLSKTYLTATPATEMAAGAGADAVIIIGK